MSYNKLVIVSGYFNPLHQGHLDLFETAKKIGDLCVIVNNDVQVKLKGTIPFLDEETRYRIIKNIHIVGKTYLSIDDTLDISKTIEYVVDNSATFIESNVAPMLFFLNSGDRTTTVSPEDKICKELGILQLYANLPKVESSSLLLQKSYEWLRKYK
jgi:cytidyltransferase-like protein